MRGATSIQRLAHSRDRYFNPRAPCGARPVRLRRFYHTNYISIHAPLAGRDCGKRRFFRAPVLFQSTRPLRGATLVVRGIQHQSNHFNPRAPCGARPVRLRRFYHTNYISIHAPLAGRDAIRDAVANGTMPFQSTRPLRGATPALPCVMRDQSYFNPRAPCGARPLPTGTPMLSTRFQSTRPLRGATSVVVVRDRLHQNFNPRAPCGARPARGLLPPLTVKISIHAPLAGRDGLSRAARIHYIYFNPRAPCGARHHFSVAFVEDSTFQSTRPLRGATLFACFRISFDRISIHAPLAGRDLTRTVIGGRALHFNPRAPCGARLRASRPTAAMSNFNPRAPCGARLMLLSATMSVWHFNPRAPCGARLHGLLMARRRFDFNPRAPCGARRLNHRRYFQPLLFQSTRPLRGATGRNARACQALLISIHAPLAGRDR